MSTERNAPAAAAPPGAFAVIATRMPYIDRRALSQAWFSALHVASDGRPRATLERRRADARFASVSARVIPPATGEARPQPGAPQAWTGVERRRPRVCGEAVRGEVATRATLRAVRPDVSSGARDNGSFRTSLAFGLDGARVQLLLRREGATLHVVALCPPGVEGLVRRALACADAHLRLRGEEMRASVRTLGAEARA
jgi:hypothetical protein